MYHCLLCSQELRDDEAGRVACRACQVRLSNELRELPWLYRKLGPALLPGTGEGGPHVSGSRAVPSPVNETALEMRAWGGMVTDLEAHEEDWRRALGLGAMARFRGSVEQALEATVEFLGAHLWWACERYGDLDGFAADVRRLRGAALSVVAPRPASRRLGYCVALVGEEGAVCGAVVSLAPGASVARCRWCSASWPPDTWLTLAAAQVEAGEGVVRPSRR